VVNSTISLIIIDDRTVIRRISAAEHKAEVLRRRARDAPEHTATAEVFRRLARDAEHNVLADDDYQVLNVSDSLTPNEIIQQELGLPLETRTREHWPDTLIWEEARMGRALCRE